MSAADGSGNNGRIRYLMACPHMSLGRGPYARIDFGRWTIMRLSDYDGDWPDPQAEAAARALLGGYRDSLGNAIQNPCVIFDQVDGILVDLPDEDEREIMQASLLFALLDANPNVMEIGEGAQVWPATSDNADIHFWPIGPPWDVVSFTIGSVARQLHGWTLLADDFAIPAPVEVPSIISAHPRPPVLAACYEYLADLSNDATRRERTALLLALSWFAKAWRNTQSISVADRVVMLKIAFEVLTDKGASHEQATWIAETFNSLFASPDARPREREGLLASPSDIANCEHVWQGRNGKRHRSVVSDVEHWYMAFADARNQIVHAGDVQSLNYEACGSPYNGHFFMVGERLFRETVKARLALAGYPQVWHSYVDPKILADLQKTFDAEMAEGA